MNEELVGLRLFDEARELIKARDGVTTLRKKLVDAKASYGTTVPQ
jgi:hypothetical protein